MRRLSIIKAAILSIFIILLFSSCSAKETANRINQKEVSQKSVVVTFNDVVFEKIIRDELKNNTDTITIPMMETIEELGINSAEIRDLSGLEYATNLKKLSIKNTPVDSLSALENLLRLQELELYRVGITEKYPEGIQDLSMIGSLGNLTTLSIGGNTLTDLSFLGTLVNLKNLRIYDANITQPHFENIFSFDNLKSLQVVDVSGNLIVDIAPFFELEQLLQLNIANNPIGEIGQIDHFKKLASIGVDYQQLSNNAVVFSSLPNLIEIQIKDISTTFDSDEAAKKIIESIISKDIAIKYE